MKSMGDCVSRNLRACKTATNILCRAVMNASAVPHLTLSVSNSGANPQSRKHGGHWSMGGRPVICAAAVLMSGRWVSRTVCVCVCVWKKNIIEGKGRLKS